MKCVGPSLGLIAKFTVGVDDVDLDAATYLGIMVTMPLPSRTGGGVAEGTMAMTLTLRKKSACAMKQ